MRRLFLIAVLALSACDKPDPESCRKALLNVQHLNGTENPNDPASLEGEVRRCRGGSSKESVECAIKATSLDELHKCGFHKPAKGSGSGS